MVASRGLQAHGVSAERRPCGSSRWARWTAWWRSKCSPHCHTLLQQRAAAPMHRGRSPATSSSRSSLYVVDDQCCCRHRRRVVYDRDRVHEERVAVSFRDRCNSNGVLLTGQTTARKAGTKATCDLSKGPRRHPISISTKRVILSPLESGYHCASAHGGYVTSNELTS